MRPSPEDAPKTPLTLIRKQDAVASQILDRWEPRKPARPPEPPGPETELALVLLSPVEEARCTAPSPDRPVQRSAVTEEATLPLLRPDEVLVVDPRGRLTPAQAVEQKLLALLRTGNPGLYAQAVGGRPDIRRTRGARQGAEPLFRDA
jgi:hypothetical protein